MSATDELRKLLDERGIMHKTDTFVIDADHGKVKETAWVIGDSHYVYQEYRDKTVLTSTPITPEQAIAVTLGSAERTCEYCKDGKFDGQSWMISNHGWQRINNCPNCGAKVVDR